MSLPTTVAEVIDRHVKFTLESVDRMYLNVYQPMLQRGGGVSVFFRQHRREACATALVMSRMTKAFVDAVERRKIGLRELRLSLPAGRADVIQPVVEAMIAERGGIHRRELRRLVEETLAQRFELLIRRRRWGRRRRGRGRWRWRGSTCRQQQRGESDNDSAVRLMSQGTPLEKIRPASRRSATLPVKVSTPNKSTAPRGSI